MIDVNRAPLLLTLLAAFAPATAAAEPPPVQVEILPEAVEDPLFGRSEAKRSAPSGSQVVTQSQVVNVFLPGGEKGAADAAPRPPSGPLDPAGGTGEERALERDMQDARARIQARRLEGPPAGEPKDPLAEPQGEVNVEARSFFGERWRRRGGVKQGDFLLSVGSGVGPAGRAVSGAAELLLRDRVGLRLGFTTGVFGPDSLDRRATFAERATPWGADPVFDARGFRHAATHLVDASFVLHLRANRPFDVYATAGLSHFGYYVSRDRGSDLGGGLFLRAGAGLRWFWRSFFVGGELGWYPVEMLRYEVVQGPAGTAASRNFDPEWRADASRYTAAFQLGWRF